MHTLVFEVVLCIIVVILRRVVVGVFQGYVEIVNREIK